MDSVQSSGGDLITPLMTINITDLPISDPNCNGTQCRAFYEACKLQAQGQGLYGYYTVGTYCFLILCFAIRYARRLILNRYPTEPKPRTTIWQKFRAAHRYWSYRQTTGNFSRWLAISYGAAALWIGFSILVIVASFAEQPYYRICTTWGMPPPLANRAGAMSVSLTPLVIILAQKWNVSLPVPGIRRSSLRPRASNDKHANRENSS